MLSLRECLLAFSLFDLEDGESVSEILEKSSTQELEQPVQLELKVSNRDTLPGYFHILIRSVQGSELFHLGCRMRRHYRNRQEFEQAMAPLASRGVKISFPPLSSSHDL